MPTHAALVFIVRTLPEQHWTVDPELPALRPLFEDFVVDCMGLAPPESSTRCARRIADSILGRLSILRSEGMWTGPVRSLTLKSHMGEVLLHDEAKGRP